MSELKRRGIQAVRWDLLGKLITQLTAFSITVLLARWLSPEDFGLVAMIVAIVGVASVLVDVGLGSALIQRDALDVEHCSSVFWINILMGAILSTMSYACAPLIADFYGNSKIDALVRVLSAMFLINALGNTQTAMLQRELNYAVLTRANVMSVFVGGIGGLSFAYNGAGPWSLVAQSIVTGLCYVATVWVGSAWRPSFVMSRKAISELLPFGMNMFMVRMLDATVTRIDLILIGRLFPMDVLGFYDRAKHFNNLIARYSSDTLMVVLFPVISRVQNDIPRLRGIVNYVLGGICFASFLLFGLLYMVAEKLIILVLGDKWQQTAQYYEILLLSGFAYSINALLLNILKGKGNSKAFFKLELFKKTIFLLNMSLLLFLGIKAYIYGLVVVAAFGLALNVVFASRDLQCSAVELARPVVVQLLVALGSVAVAMALLLAFGPQEIGFTLLSGALYIVLYVGGSAVLRTSPYESFNVLFRKIIIKK